MPRFCQAADKFCTVYYQFADSAQQKIKIAAAPVDVQVISGTSEKTWTKEVNRIGDNANALPWRDWLSIPANPNRIRIVFKNYPPFLTGQAAVYVTLENYPENPTKYRLPNPKAFWDAYYAGQVKSGRNFLYTGQFFQTREFVLEGEKGPVTLSLDYAEKAFVSITEVLVETGCKLSIASGGKIFFEQEGKAPCIYEVVCGEGCPKGYCKQKLANGKFCCIPSDVVIADIRAMKSILRRR